MQAPERRVIPLMVSLLTLLSIVHTGGAQHSSPKPRLLALPWIVIDRTSNQRYDSLPSSQSSVHEEGKRLAQSAQAALDGTLHRDARIEMIPRREWEPHWRQFTPEQILWPGAGCAACAPVGDLLHFDRAAIRSLAEAVGAEYVWLGLTVVPLTWALPDPRPDECCREALAQPRKAILARSSALLVRVRDGEIVWQRDARRLDRDVPRRGYRTGVVTYPASPRSHRDAVTGHERPEIAVVPTALSAAERQEIAVDDTARMLGKAFPRVHRQVLR